MATTAGTTSRWRVSEGEEARLTPGAAFAAEIRSCGPLPLRARRAALHHARPAFAGTAVVLGRQTYEVVEEAEPDETGAVVYRLRAWPEGEVFRDRVVYGAAFVRAARPSGRRSAAARAGAPVALPAVPARRAAAGRAAGPGLRAPGPVRRHGDGRVGPGRERARDDAPAAPRARGRPGQGRADRGLGAGAVLLRAAGARPRGERPAAARDGRLAGRDRRRHGAALARRPACSRRARGLRASHARRVLAATGPARRAGAATGRRPPAPGRPAPPRLGSLAAARGEPRLSGRWSHACRNASAAGWSTATGSFPSATRRSRDDPARPRPSRRRTPTRCGAGSGLEWDAFNSGFAWLTSLLGADVQARAFAHRGGAPAARRPTLATAAASAALGAYLLHFLPGPPGDPLAPAVAVLGLLLAADGALRCASGARRALRAEPAALAVALEGAAARAAGLPGPPGRRARRARPAARGRLSADGAGRALTSSGWR